jgi:hypothetical protein
MLKAGTIVFNRAGAIDAIVRNLSETGAMLDVESVLDIPNEFELNIKTDNLRRDCKVIWRQPSRLGIRFI